MNEKINSRTDILIKKELCIFEDENVGNSANKSGWISFIKDKNLSKCMKHGKHLF